MTVRSIDGILYFKKLTLSEKENCAMSVLSEKAEWLLNFIIDRTPPDGWLPCTDIIGKDKYIFLEAGHELEAKGMIESFNPLGRKYFSCCLTRKGRDYGQHKPRLERMEALAVFEKLLPKYREALLSIVSRYPEGSSVKADDVFAKYIPQLKDRGYLAKLKKDILGGYIVYGYTYADLNYEELEQEHDEKQKFSQTINVTGNPQINTAMHGGMITATQNVGVNAAELSMLIKTAKENIPEEISHEEKEEIRDNLDLIKDELSSDKPKKGFLQRALQFLQGIKGTAEFVAAIAGIASFVNEII